MPAGRDDESSSFFVRERSHELSAFGFGLLSGSNVGKASLRSFFSGCRLQPVTTRRPPTACPLRVAPPSRRPFPPRDRFLDALVEAFARGDYASVRARAPEVERSSDDPAVKQAARTLADRTRPDPLAVGLLAIAAVLLTVLATRSIVHGHAPSRFTR